MKDLARRGAQARLAELVAEMDSILEAFPDLGKTPARPPATPKKRRVSPKTKAKMRAAWARRKAAAGETQVEVPTEQATEAAAEAAPKKKRVMSAAARAKISAAQKRRWKAQKAGKKR